jgi:hypothetical protein
MLGRLAKESIRLVAASILTAAMTILPAVHVAFAVSTDSSLPSEYAEMLRLAEEKVHAATQPGAFGNGVPILNIDPAGMLPWIGLGVALSIGAVISAKLLTPRMKSQVLTAQ